MTQNFVAKPVSYDTLEKHSFIVATSGGILMGTPVKLDTNGKVVTATSLALAIGIVDNMPDYRAENETGTVALGDAAQVVLFGKTFQGLSGGTFSKSQYLDITTGTLTYSASATDAIALDASTAAGQLCRYMVK